MNRKLIKQARNMVLVPILLAAGLGLLFSFTSNELNGEGEEENKESELVWNTNFEASKEQATEGEKYILLNFSGSDWCGNCIRLDRTFFQSEAFKEFAPQHFVLLNADFPMKKKNKLSKEQTAHNDKLSEKYNKKGVFPKTLVLNAQGEIVGMMKHPLSSPADYIKNLEDIVLKSK